MMIALLLATYSFAQKYQVVQSTRYVKTVQPDYTAGGTCNFESKNDEEKLLFGDFNAPVEFIFAPSFDGISGLRIYQDSLNQSYLLEAKRVTNWEEVNNQLKAEFPSDRKVSTITLAQWEEQKKQMEANKARKREEWLRRQTIFTQVVRISDTLAVKFYETVAKAIGKARKELKTNAIINDGDEVVFRCVVGDELWTLKYHQPEGEYKALSDLFRAMIADVEAGTFDETKYLEALN